MIIKKEEKKLNLLSEMLNENFARWVEQDIVLPDTKPDAIKLLNVSVNAYVENIEVLNESVKVTGRLNYFVIYKADESNMGIRGVLSSSTFTESFNVKNINDKMNVQVVPKVRNIIYALPNERKISVKTEILFSLNAVDVTEVPLIEGFKEDINVEVKMKEDVFDNIIEIKKEVITSSDDMILKDENSDLGEILKIKAKIANEEYKQSYNKLLVKGDILVKMLYLSTDTANEIKTAKLTIPFTSMIDFSNIKDSYKFDLKYSIKELDIKVNSDITSNKTITATYKIDCIAKMYEKQEISYVDDFYSSENNLKYEKKEKNVIKSKDKFEKTIEVTKLLENAVSNGYKVIDYDTDTSNVVIKSSENNFALDGNLKINIISANVEVADVESKTFDISIDEKIEMPEGVKNLVKNFDLKINDISLSQNGRNIDIKINMIFTSNLYNITKAEYIDDIELDEINLKDFDSMSIYVVKNGDTLWSIAKKYKTTVDKIAEVNNIENKDLINVGKKLLIIR